MGFLRNFFCSFCNFLVLFLYFCFIRMLVRNLNSLCGCSSKDGILKIEILQISFRLLFFRCFLFFFRVIAKKIILCRCLWNFHFVRIHILHGFRNIQSWHFQRCCLLGLLCSFFSICFCFSNFLYSFFRLRSFFCILSSLRLFNTFTFRSLICTAVGISLRILLCWILLNFNRFLFFHLSGLRLKLRYACVLFLSCRITEHFFLNFFACHRRGHAVFCLFHLAASENIAKTFGNLILETLHLIQLFRLDLNALDFLLT